MGKRANENAQISKEEYQSRELASERGGGSSDLTAGSFERAGGDQLKRRRIVAAGGSFGAAKDASASLAPATAPGRELGRGERKDRILNRKFLQMAENESRGNPHSDWSVWVREYLEYADEVYRELGGGGAGGGDRSSRLPAAGDAAAAAPPAPTPAPATPAPVPPAGKLPFSFGDKPTEEPKPFNFGLAPKPFSGLNFGAAPAAAAGTAAPPPTRPIPAGGGDDGDDGAPADEPEEVKPEVNADEEVLHEVRAKYFKWDGGWKGFDAGPLRLYQNKNDPTRKRMVLRNAVGKVQLNLQVAKGMRFEKEVGKKWSFVRFLAIQDQEKGVEKFTLAVAKEKLDGLHKALEGMAA